jgi:putative phage-type endonuclease
MIVLRQGTPDWLAQRREVVGASDVPAVYGRDPYRGEWDLWLEKTGRAEDSASTWPMTWGNHVQRLGVAVYSDLTGKKVRNITSPTRNKRWPHVQATLDARVIGEPIGVEVKWTSRSVHEALEHWRLQVQAQMGVCNLEWVDILRLNGRDEPAIFTVERDDALIDEMLDGAEAWYCRYVLGDEPPPMDGSRGASRYLDSLPAEDIPMMASAEQDILVAERQRLKRAQAEAGQRIDLVENRIKESMMGSYRLESRDYHVIWKPTKPRTTTDWRSVAALYRDSLLMLESAMSGETSAAVAAYDAIETAHTTTGKGSRPFTVYEEEA